MLESLYIFFGHGMRGLMWAVFGLVLTLLIIAFMPSEASYLDQPLPIYMYKRMAFLIGAFFAFDIWIICWIKDYKRGYIPHWYLG